MNDVSKDIKALTAAEIVDLFRSKTVFVFDGGLKLKSGDVINCQIEKRSTQEGQELLKVNLSSGHAAQFLSTFEFVTTMETRVLLETVKIIEMGGLHCLEAVLTANKMAKKLNEETEE